MTILRKYGLIGFPLTHSFSPDFFTKKFSKEGLDHMSYQAYELHNLIDFPALIQREFHLFGLNVTIPHKEKIIPYLDHLSTEAEAITAVNTIVIKRDSENIVCTGHNTDCTAFEKSLIKLIGKHRPQALVLGTGGASKAVTFVLQKINIPYRMVSRQESSTSLSYEQVNHQLLKEYRLVINTTPLGMYPKSGQRPSIPYEALTNQHFLFDLIYNPAETAFLAAGKNAGASTCNGLEMLHLQAEASWRIWQKAAAE